MPKQNKQHHRYGTSEGKKKKREIQCLNVNQINSSEERYNTATRKKGMKSARRRESKKKTKQDNFLRGSTLTQENNSKDKRDRRC